MAINKRETILAASTAVLFVLVAGWFLLGFMGGSLAQLRAQNENLKAEVEEKQSNITRAARSFGRLADWNKRCLPSNIEAAGSEYQNWLMGLCEDVSLSDRKVDIITQRTEISGWTRILLSIHGRGTLEQLTNLLDQFYEADHLQQIVSLNVKPVAEGSKTLDLIIAIEAVSLPGAVYGGGGDDHRAKSDKLYEEQVAGAADGSDDPGKESDEPSEEKPLDDYLDSIAARNMFMPYSPPPPPPTEHKPELKPEPPKPPGFDHLKYTVVTAIVEVNDQRQVWILTRTTGRLHKLVKGQSFQLGEEADPARATIGTISPREVEVISDHDGRQYMVALGDNLLPPPPAATEDRPAATEHRPAATEDQPAATEDQPAGSM